jgi:ABC-2 type transport system ATP-binding protein
VERKKVLECCDLYKKFGKKEILKGISLEANEGDILGFIGPNGAGKTTTIKLILGLQSITSGSVKINGFDIQKDFTKAIQKVGTIVENPDLYMYMSGYENLKMISNLYSGITKERIDEVIKFVGLENRIKDKVSKYSLGMRQRLGIAQAILHKPNLLVLDEPTNGLDPEGIKQIKDLIVKLAKEENMAVLISSHNLLELESFCTKVTIIKNGEIVETSTIEEAKKVNKDSIYHLVVDKTTEVLNILENKLEKLDDENIQVYAKKEEIPEIIEKLVTSGVKIYSVYPEEMSLEDAFLKKTGGNVIV